MSAAQVVTTAMTEAEHHEIVFEEVVRVVRLPAGAGAARNDQIVGLGVAAPRHAPAGVFPGGEHLSERRMDRDLTADLRLRAL